MVQKKGFEHIGRIISRHRYKKRASTRCTCGHSKVEHYNTEYADGRCAFCYCQTYQSRMKLGGGTVERPVAALF